MHYNVVDSWYVQPHHYIVQMSPTSWSICKCLQRQASSKVTSCLGVSNSTRLMSVGSWQTSGSGLNVTPGHLAVNLARFLTLFECICFYFELYLLLFWNVFSFILKCICFYFKMYLLLFWNALVKNLICICQARQKLAECYIWSPCSL